jgi:hypothetical protein
MRISLHGSAGSTFRQDQAFAFVRNAPHALALLHPRRERPRCCGEPLTFVILMLITGDYRGDASKETG